MTCGGFVLGLPEDAANTLSIQQNQFTPLRKCNRFLCKGARGYNITARRMASSHDAIKFAHNLYAHLSGAPLLALHQIQVFALA